MRQGDLTHRGRDHGKPPREQRVDDEGRRQMARLGERWAVSNLMLQESADAFAFSGSGEDDLTTRKIFGQPT